MKMGQNPILLLLMNHSFFGCTNVELHLHFPMMVKPMKHFLPEMYINSSLIQVAEYILVGDMQGSYILKTILEVMMKALYHKQQSISCTNFQQIIYISLLEMMVTELNISSMGAELLRGGLSAPYIFYTYIPKQGHCVNDCTFVSWRFTHTFITSTQLFILRFICDKCINLIIYSIYFCHSVICRSYMIIFVTQLFAEAI